MLQKPANAISFAGWSSPVRSRQVWRIEIILARRPQVLARLQLRLSPIMVDGAGSCCTPITITCGDEMEPNERRNAGDY